MVDPARIEELLSKAQKPSADALRLPPFYRGKLAVTPKCPIRTLEDFAIWYTPGVAAPCREIAQHPERVYAHTNKGNFVAIVSDGTRVLGLGDIGPHAALPVMEGKAVLFKYLGGVDAFPICLGTKNPDEIIQACKWLGPTFGGINLEDIAKPKCFTILERLRAESDIPVWHDDRQGTAAVILAGLLNALKVVNKIKGEARIVLIGVGAANVAVARVLAASGFPSGNLMLVDTKGILHREREDLRTPDNVFKWKLCELSNPEQRKGGIAEALKGADACIALSRSGPGVIKSEWVASMAKDAIIFACANPVPEVWPWEAEKAGARIIATGRSDFPNQVNNSLGFPAIFRGYLHEEERYHKCFADGWYLTGDLAKQDADGYFWFVGRADDVIKSSGHLIGPFEVESALMEHHAVAEVGVIGKPDPVAGEVVNAFVSLKTGYTPNEELRREVLGFARKRLGAVVAPKEIDFVASVPKTRSGKIMRRLLKARELGLPEGDTSTLENET